MTAGEWRRTVRDSRSHQVGSWGLSVLVHAFVVGCAFKGFVEVPPPVIAEAFRWEVAMVQPPVPSPVEEQTPVQPPQPPKTSPPVPEPPRPLPQAGATPLPKARPLQHQTQVVASLPDIRESVDQPAQTEMAVEQTSVSTEREMNHREIVEQDATVSVVQAAVAQAEPVARPLEAVTPAEPVSASAQQVVDSETVATVQQTSASVSRTAVEQVESFAEARPVEHRRLSHSKPVAQQVSVNEEAPAAIAQRVVKERTLRSFPQTQVDYGWLSDILWGRIEQLKRYPPLAKHNHWEGKVIVEAVIQDDGAIIESQIAESSGHAVLDQQALAVLKQASPLALKHPLGQRRVTILVPITYRLDG